MDVRWRKTSLSSIAMKNLSCATLTFTILFLTVTGCKEGLLEEIMNRKGIAKKTMVQEVVHIFSRLWLRNLFFGSLFSVSTILRPVMNLPFTTWSCRTPRIRMNTIPISGSSARPIRRATDSRSFTNKANDQQGLLKWVILLPMVLEQVSPAWYDMSGSGWSAFFVAGSYFQCKS